MTDVDLPYNARTNEIFSTRVWVADLTALGPSREQLVNDVLEAANANEGASGLGTEPVLQDRPEPWWTHCHEMVDAFTHALAARLIPGFKYRSVHSWATVRRSSLDYQDPVDPLTTFQGSTYTCILPLQIPVEFQGDVTMTLRDPLFHLRNRLGFDTDCAVVPGELRLLVFPGYLERFARTPPVAGPFSRPAVSLVFDVWYY